MSSKQATAVALASAKAGQELRLPPEDLILVENKSHPLYQDRVHRPTDPNMVADMQAGGWVHGTVLVVGEVVDTLRTGKYLVVAGRGRTKAAIEAGLADVPCVDLGAESEYSASELKAFMARENERRVDTNPLEKAAEALSLMNTRLEEMKPPEWPSELAWKPSKDQRSEAVRFTAGVFGKSTSWVNHLVSLLDEDKVSAGLTKAMKNEEVSVNAAMKFMKLNPLEQEEVLEKLKPVIKAKAEAAATGKGRGKAISRKEADAVINKNAKCSFERSWLEKILSRRGTPADVKAFVKELLNPGSQDLPYLPGKLEKLRSAEMDSDE